MLIASLKNQREFALINQEGIKKYGRYLIIIAAKETSLSSKKFAKLLLGLKVSKKLSKKAILRNKFRRRLKHITRLAVQERKYSLPQAVIIIPKLNVKEASFAEIKQDFSRIMRQYRFG